MDIVMLAAGMSKRMKGINKLLLLNHGVPLLQYSVMEALKYLLSANENNSLIVVTGYARKEAEKTLIPCKEYLFESSAKTNMEIVYNPDYEKGQFSSTQKGVEKIPHNRDFFITLADKPLISSIHYKEIENIKNSYAFKSENYMAIRPFYNGTPGHPVWHKSVLKNAILNAPQDSKVSDILKNYSVLNVNMKDSAYIRDLDTKEEAVKLGLSV